MKDPGVLFGVSTLLGGVNDVVGSVAQADAIRAANESAQLSAATNMRLAALRAAQVRRAGQHAGQQAGKQAAARRGARRAAQGASGVVAGQGSSGAVEDSESREGSLDQLSIHNSAWAQAWGIETQAVEMGLQAEFGGQAASNQANATILTGGLKALNSGLLGYATYDKYFKKGS
jgi:hypothetical protein